MVGLIATAASPALFSGVYPSAGSFLTFIARAMGTRTSVVVGVMTLLGYIIAFGGIYIFVGQYIVQNVLNDPHIWGITQIVTIIYGALVVAPVVLGLKFGVRTTVVLYLFEVVLLLVLAITVLAKGGTEGLSATPFTWPSGSGTQGHLHRVLVRRARLRRIRGGRAAGRGDPQPRRNVPLAVIGTVAISGILYVFCSYALIIAFGPSHVGALAADGNPFETAAKHFIAPLAPLITWIFLTSVTSSYVAANTQTSRVIFAGARGGLWPKSLAAVSPRFRTPWAAAIAFVAPSIAIGVISTAFTDPGTAVGLLSTYGILGLVLMYLMANVALIVQWAGSAARACTRTCGPGWSPR